ncbi:MAG: cyclic nucleotide-binding domain-containing protein, partial [Nitrospira sp.]|nr:cyclic nucleotide-binding domain-containing protein [Nitrospira sp.]
MGAAKKLAAKRVDEKLLTRYLPFQSLELEDLKNLAPKCQLLSYPSNRILFRRGDNDPRTYFLVTGEIEISSRRIGILRLKAGTEAARDAIADVIPRRVEMRTTQPTTFLVIDRHLLEVTTNSELAANYHVSEMESSDDWMSMFLGSLNTNKIPPQNIQALLLRMKEIPVQPGHVIVRQGDKDSHYYIIKEGRCAVTRYTPEHGDTTLAELGAGTGFGEEALITKSTRNATVTMLEPGTVMRLSKEDFLQLLVRPVVDLVTYPEAEELVAQGGKLIDIRMHIDRQDYLEGAALIPMPELRARLPQLPKSQPCIVFCNNGQVSAAAAFLLAQHGFDAYVLMGGIERVSPGARLLQRVRLGAVPEAASPFEEQSRSRADKQERKFRQTQELKTDDQLADIATDDATGDHRPWLQKLQQEVHNLRQELERDRRDISSLREGLVPGRHDAPGTRSMIRHAA